MNYAKELEAMRGYGAIDPAANPGEQKSIEWLMSRCGKVTASNFKHVMDFTAKGKPSEKRTTYLWQVVIERLTGVPTEHYVNAAMQHGLEFEPAARMAYEAHTGRIVAETGFINHQSISNLGGSPDGTIDDDGLIEIKCLQSRNHLNIVLNGDISEYLAQTQGLIFITGRAWCDFVSFDPRLPDYLQLYIERIDRDTEYIAALEENVISFLGEVDELHNALVKRKKAHYQRVQVASLD